MSPASYGILVIAITVCWIGAVVCDEEFKGFTRFDMFELLKEIDGRIIKVLRAPRATVAPVKPSPVGQTLINLLKEYNHIFAHVPFMIKKRDRETLPLYDQLFRQNGPMFLQVRFDADVLCFNFMWTTIELGWVHRLFAKAAQQWVDFRMTDVHNMNMTWIHPFSKYEDAGL